MLTYGSKKCKLYFLKIYDLDSLLDANSPQTRMAQGLFKKLLRKTAVFS